MDEILERLRQFRDERDWTKFHTAKDLAISVALEASELLELFQWTDSRDPLTEEKRDCAAKEAADVLVYLLYFCDHAGIDLIASTHEKISHNEIRYPVDEARGVAGNRRRRHASERSDKGAGSAET